MSNKFTEITVNCDSDTSPTVDGDALADGESCVFDDGSDLIVWTTHFTTWVVSNNLPSGSVGGNGSSSSDIYPPSFITGFSEDEYPITIGDTPLKQSQLTNKVDTTMIQPGEHIQVKLLLYENKGPENIQHVAVYTYPSGTFRGVDNTDTGISYEKGQDVIVVDPNNIFSDVDIQASEIDNKLELIFDITFAKEMEKSDIVIRAWDNNRNSVQIVVLDAWQVIKEVNAPLVDVAADIEAPTQRVPLWIKNNAKWWSNGQIGESDFVNGIQYMIKEKIINIPDLPEQASEIAKEKVPGWIKNNAGWWADGLISDEDFISGIKYLVEYEIIRI